MEINLVKLANEQNTSKKPILKCSIDKIEKTVKLGGKIKGKFKIYNASAGELRGQIFSALREVSISKSTFKNETVIEFTIEISSYESEDKKESYIQIISNGGEVKIPVILTIQPQSFDTSIGLINDLFQFSDLAKSSWNEAVKIFVDNNFSSVFLKKLPKKEKIYKLLIKSNSKEQALEEFLMANNKKQQIEIKLSSEAKDYIIQEAIVADSFNIISEGWGFFEAEIFSKNPFIKVITEKLTHHNFVDKKGKIRFDLVSSHMSYGYNEGQIIIKFNNKKLYYTVKAFKEKPIEIYLEQLSYTINEIGQLIIKNNQRQNINIRIEPTDKWINLEKDYYQTDKDIKIPLNFKKPTLGKLLNKHLIVKTGVNISVMSQKYNIKEKVPVIIALESIV
ncbi:MAG: DUF5717 family protein [bacterium]